MVKNPRRIWTSLLFIGFFAPFLVMAIVKHTSRLGQVDHSQAAATRSGDARALASAAELPLLAAGDGLGVWVAWPMMDNGVPGFQLLHRAAHAPYWRAAARHGVQSFWNEQGFPRAIMLRLPPDGQGAGTPFVIGAQARVSRYTLEDGTIRQQLPPDDRVLAATGAPDSLFAITLGPPDDRPLRWGESLQAQRRTSGPVSTTSAAREDTTAAESATAPASDDAAHAASAPVAATGVLHTRWHTPANEWSYLPPLEAIPGEPDSAPTPAALMAAAERNQRLIVLWVEPARPRILIVRTLEYNRENAPWSVPLRTTLSEDIPAESRLLTTMVDGTLYVLWTVPTGDSVELHGGWMNTDPQANQLAYRLAPGNLLDQPMRLREAGRGISPARDVAVGASANSILAVVRNRDKELSWMLFDPRGRGLSDPAPVQARMPRRDVQIGQSIAMVLLALLMMLSLWQWRQQPPTLALPSGTVIAPLHLRAGAFLIDAAIPYVAMLMIFGMADGAPFHYFSAWLSAAGNPEELIQAVELFVFLGLYLGHVTAGELFFHRSLGKALVGARVVMLDGTPPTVAAILLRNLIRLPEFAVGIVILYILISDRRQRLGDLVARTLVVSPRPLETPPDSEDGQRRR